MQLEEPDNASFINISTLQTSDMDYLHVISFKHNSMEQKG